MLLSPSRFLTTNIHGAGNISILPALIGHGIIISNTAGDVSQAQLINASNVLRTIMVTYDNAASNYLYSLIVGGGAGEVNVNANAGTTNVTKFGLVNPKVGVTNFLKTIEPGYGLAATNQGTNLVLAVDAAIIPSQTQLVTASNVLNTAIDTKQSGSALLTNFSAMGITNIVAGTNVIIRTNAGTLVINGVPDGVGSGGGALATNQNQFGPSTILTLKEYAYVTNLVAWQTLSADDIISGGTLSAEDGIFGGILSVDGHVTLNAAGSPNSILGLDGAAGVQTITVGNGLAFDGTNLTAQVSTTTLNTVLNSASNVLQRASSNNVRVTYAGNVPVTASSSGGIMTYTVDGLYDPDFTSLQVDGSSYLNQDTHLGSELTLDALSTNALLYTAAGSLVSAATVTAPLTFSGGTLTATGLATTAQLTSASNVLNSFTISTGTAVSNGAVTLVTNAITVTSNAVNTTITNATSVTSNALRTVIDSKQQGSAILTNLSLTGAHTNITSANGTFTSLLQQSNQPIVKTISAGAGIALTNNLTNIVIASTSAPHIAPSLQTSNFISGATTNIDYVINTYYTNGTGWAWVQSGVLLHWGDVNDIPGMGLYIDQDADGTFEETGNVTSIGGNGSISFANPQVEVFAVLRDILKPGARFVFTNITLDPGGNPSYATIRPNSSKLWKTGD